MFNYPTYENDFEFPDLAQMFHQYAEESVTDEQVQRVLKPIFERIDAGEFKKGHNPRRLGGTPFVREEGNEITRQSYKFQLASPYSCEASLEIVWKGTQMHICIEYK